MSAATTERSAELCVNGLMEMEASVSAQQLFNVGYIIPQVTLLETRLLEQDQADVALAAFLTELEQLVAEHGREDGLSSEDLQCNMQLLVTLEQNLKS